MAACSAAPTSRATSQAIARIATHALLLVETLAGFATTQARDSLLDAGFDNVTILIAGRGPKAKPAKITPAHPRRRGVASFRPPPRERVRADARWLARSRASGNDWSPAARVTSGRNRHAAIAAAA